MQNGEKKKRKMFKKIVSGALLIALTISLFLLMTGPSGAEQLISKTFTPKSSKDPFMPVVGPQGSDETPVTPVNTTDKTVKTETGKTETITSTGSAVGTFQSTPATVTQISGEQIGVKVTGIVKGKKGYTAILSSGQGTGYLVNAGQKLGDWKVTSITKDTVTLKTKKYVAMVKLASEFDSSAKGTKSETPEKVNIPVPKTEKAQ